MIRPYETSDQSQVVDLLKQNIPQYFDPSELDDFLVYLEKELEDYFVFEQDQQLVGAGGINYFSEEKLARISWDFIHADFQGKGIGSQLLQFRINHIRKQSNFEKIVVRTSQLVFPFYEKNGFTLEKVVKDFWAEGYDLYEMHLLLG